MSLLRKQLHAARSEHQSTRYPGDLALLLPSARRNWFEGRIISSLAAAATLALVAGISIQLSHKSLGATRIQAWLPSAGDLPRLPPRGEMAGAIKSLTPPEVPDLLMDVKQPLVSSGQFIYEIGKDIAHQADALFHMG